MYGRPAVTDLDARFTLANERTFLAWLRTALALVAAGVAVQQLVPQFAFSGARWLVAMLLVALGALVALGGVLRWKNVQLAMERGEALPPTRMPVLLGAGLTVLAVVIAVLLAVDVA